MGQYLQMGICYQVEVDKKRLDKLEMSFEKLTNELNKHFDLSLYDVNKTHDKITFKIKESITLELQKFLEFQYSMYLQELPYTDCFESALQTIGKLSSIKEIIELAEEKKYPCFQSNKIVDEVQVSAWQSLRMEISNFVFFIEGKIIMEGYNPFLRYIENNVREASDNWSIAGAFKCYID